MAKRNDAQPAGLKKKPAAAAKKAAPAGGPGLLRAGLKALGTVREDVAKRQTNVIESLLGIGAKAATPRSFPGLDTFGFRKFEDVFDQRVATAVERLGLPTAQEIDALRDEIAQLREEIAQLRSQLAKLGGTASRKR